ncbi:Mob1/phocein [Catenaria anguillulae PL171]|uniref:Mob1/phocein n=1 Tax=Catenaria anguillulae PL171 TaxID=765915 RepID=A0A1Y2HN60_9FUNG|nr:Mob1/phocein [Catenaria anguillulae PL171]
MSTAAASSNPNPLAHPIPTQVPAPQRNNPGTKWADFYSSYATVTQLEDSPFGYQDLLQQRVRDHRNEPELLVSVPVGGDPLVWQYEHLRQFCLELSAFVIALNPECSSTTCPQMKANEWQYLCAAHSTPQNCCAFDYIVHTLDGACGLLNNAKFFPSRVTMSANSVTQFANISRRLYRIFAHAYFHHRDAFNRVEGETALYARFLAFILKYDLMGKDTILIQ